MSAFTENIRFIHKQKASFAVVSQELQLFTFDVHLRSCSRASVSGVDMLEKSALYATNFAADDCTLPNSASAAFVAKTTRLRYRSQLRANSYSENVHAVSAESVSH